MARKRRLFFRAIQLLLIRGRSQPVLLLLLSVLTAGLCQVLPAIGTTAQSSQPLQVLSKSVAVSQGADLTQQGRMLYTAGRYVEAVQVWQQVADLAEKAGDLFNQAMALNNLSLAHQQLGQWPQARTAVTQSLSLLKQARLDQKAYRQVLAQALNTQGSLDLETGNPEAALESWERAAKTYRDAADTDGALRSQINQVQALKALGLYRRAIDLLTKIQQTLQAQPDSLTKAVGMRSLGNTLRLVGDLDQSRSVLEQSLAIAQQLQSPSDRSATFFSLGNTARTQEDFSTALQFYQQASDITPSPLLKVQAGLNQLSLLLEQGETATSTVLLPKLQAQLVDLPSSHAAIYAQINFTQSLIKFSDRLQGNGPDSTAIAQILARAIQQARSLNDARAESYALGTLGQLYEQNQQVAEALTVTQQALLIAQTTNAPDIAYQWQWQVGRLLKQQQQNQAAISAYTQAVNTLQTLRNDLVAINTNVQFSFRESVEPVYRQLVELLVQPDGSGATSQENLIKARSVIESLQLAELDNFFREACLQAKPVQVDRIDAKAAIIYPIILPDRLEVILSIPGQALRHYAVASKQEQTRETVLQMRQALSPITSSQTRTRLLRLAYDWLIRPAEADLQQQGIQTLVFVLDGPMRNFPMAALYDGSQFLMEKYSIALTPGLQLLDPQPLVRQNLKVLTGGLTESRQGFSPLPGVATELNQINAEVSSKTLLNQDLTNNNLERLLKNAPFNIVHLATHGQFSSNADDTFILTWDDRLKVKELSDLLKDRNQDTTPLELLVLSACQTASGDDRAALGLAGVAVRSGARSTIATLWSVNDEAASALMTQFYQQLATPGTTKAEALRRAQIALLKDAKFRSPYYWAPFVLVGNWL